MRECFYQCTVADHCFQYVDDLGTAASTFEQFLTNLQAVFDAVKKTGHKFFSKCEFSLKEMTFLGNSISKECISSDKKKVTDSLSTL